MNPSSTKSSSNKNHQYPSSKNESAASQESSSVTGSSFMNNGDQRKRAATQKVPQQKIQQINQTDQAKATQRLEEQKYSNLQLSEGIVGLQNYSYFCYLNSCLQCLVAIDQLRGHFLQRSYKSKFMGDQRPRIRNNFRLSLAFTKFYTQVWLKNNDTGSRSYKAPSSYPIVQPEHIKQEIYNKFSPVFQHDCHEFFTYIMSTLQDEETPILDKAQKLEVERTQASSTSPDDHWAIYDSTHPSIMDDLFTGKRWKQAIMLQGC